MTILIVDDDAQCRVMLVETLESYGIEAFSANNVQTAMPFLILASVDAVLCDGLRGQWISVWREATKREKLFALLSGDPYQIDAACTLGVRAYMKPFDLATILRGLGIDIPEALPDATGYPQ